MKIADVLKKESVIPYLRSKTKAEVIRELSEHVSSVSNNINTERLVEVLMERERLCSTAVDSGVAIPHGKLSGISNIITAFGRSIEGVDFESLDGNPTHLFILLLAPENSVGTHLKLLARFSKIFKSPEFRSKLMQAKSQDEIYELIIEEDAKH
ncbi:MAG: PTS fructose transporter subunit IIA [Deltaproteobacteria bacterium]|jgi:PTS system nitrogen regulatory IIA component|nr:MAG: PTS fructose transporter subunit IIA [Deltaproteobacteria bacterium]